MCTEGALLPENPGHVVVMLEADTVWVRRAGQSALALPAVDVSSALAASLGEILDTDNLIFYVSPGGLASTLGGSRGAAGSQCASLKVQLLNFGPLPLLAPQLPSGSYLNLLSGDFAPKNQPAGASWRQWRLAASLAVALFAVHVSGLALQLHLQHRTEQALDTAIGQIARSALPGDTGDGAVRARIERRLLAVQAGGGGGLMPALAAVAQAVQGTDGTHIETLSYQDNGLDLKLLTSNAEQLEHIDQSTTR